MTRVKRSVHARKKRRKVLAQASGYWGLKSKVYRRAKEQVQHSLQYAYRDRRVRKRDFRRLWIVRINAAARSTRWRIASWPTWARSAIQLGWSASSTCRPFPAVKHLYRVPMFHSASTCTA